MKNLKPTAIILFIFAFTNCGAQTRNILTTTEYADIKINGINWQQINNTKGNKIQAELLFGVSLTEKTGTEPSNFVALWNDSKGIYFYFEQNNPNLIGDYTIYNFSISNSNSNLTIKGKTITIGSSVEELGIIIMNGNEIYYGTDYTDDGFSIVFDLLTHKITKIEYISFN